MHRTMNHGTFAGRFGFLAGAVALAAGIAGTPAWAQSEGLGNDYCVKHKFKITTQGNAPPLVIFGYYAKAYARTNTCKDDPAPVKGVEAVGAGVTSKSAFAWAPDSTADAEAKINVTTLVAGKVAGEIEANGNADPALTGCSPPPPNRSSGWGRASSAAKVTVRGQKIDKKGQIVATGGFIAGGEVAGNTERGITRDPVVARLIDNTTGITQEWTLMSFKISNSGGEVGWDGATLWSTSDYMTFDLRIDSPVTVQQGRLMVRVEAGIVTELVQLGLFSAMPIPPVGTPGAFSVPLGEITLDYDLGGNDEHDLVPEIDVDNAGEVEKEIHAMDSGGTIVTDLGTGYDGTNVSEIPTGDTVNGYTLSASLYRLAEDLVLPPGPPVQLDAMRWPVYQVNAPAELPSVHAAFVRIWHGMPGLGLPIAGDMITNRLIDSDFTNLYRVSPQNPASPARAVRDLFIDLSWVPPLLPGQYWIEVGAEGMQNFGSVFSPPTPWHSNQDNAMQFNATTGQWQPVFDPVSQRRASFPYRIFSGSGQPTQCYADCNGDGALTVADFGCFQTKFVQGDPYADCNGDGQRTVADFGCYQTRFVQGCP